MTLIGTLLIAPPGAAEGQGAASPTQQNPHDLIHVYCVQCHGTQKQKGGIRLDTLGSDFSKVADADTWTDVMDQLNGGKMPPKNKPRPSPQEQSRLTAWIAAELQKAQELSTDARLRRLSAYEYTRTLEDLLGIRYRVPDDFPPDPAEHGFDNNPEALTISPTHLQKYLSVADEALDVAMGFNYRAPGSVPKHVFDPSDESWHHALGRHEWDINGQKLTRAIFTPGQAADMSRNYWHTGTQTIRATVAAVPGSDYPFPPRLTVTMNRRQVLDVAITGTLEHPQQIETNFFDRGNDMRLDLSNGALLPTGRGNGQPHKLDDREIKKYRATVPCLVVDRLELDGTDTEAWPPQSRTRIFFRGEKAEKTPEYAQQIIANFMTRAYRRKVADVEVQRIFNVTQRELDHHVEFERAVKSGLRVVLCSPNFLFLVEGQGPADSRKLTGRELASRLSYFLWSSMPDEELNRLAEDGSLFKPEVISVQVDRMLAGPRGGALTEKFCVGWLELNKLGAFTPDRFLYPTYEQTLQSAMIGETKAFFRIILDNDLDVSNFIRSDWLALNERMARHYGIPGVRHDDFQRVQLPTATGLGGLLTQASILCLTSDGLRTKPVARGKWILEEMLGTPPPPPPPNAGQLPNIPEFSRLTIREQLSRHRQIESCAACHAKIDPLGFVLEDFDAIGCRREHYVVPDPSLPKHVVTGFESETTLIDWAHEGKTIAIDTSGTLSDGTELKNVDDLRQVLLRKKETFLHNLSEKMFVYGMGRRARFSDRPTIDRLAQQLAREHTLRSLIRNLVQSGTFQSQ